MIPGINAFRLKLSAILALSLDILPMFWCIIVHIRTFLLLFNPCLVNNNLSKPNWGLTDSNAGVFCTPLNKVILHLIVALFIREECDFMAVPHAFVHDGSWCVIVIATAHRPESPIIFFLIVELNTAFTWCVCFYTILHVSAFIVIEGFLPNLWACCC